MKATGIAAALATGAMVAISALVCGVVWLILNAPDLALWIAAAIGVLVFWLIFFIVFRDTVIHDALRDSRKSEAVRHE